MSGALHAHAGTNHDSHNCCNDLYYQASKADLINESIVNDMETEARWTCVCTTTDITCILNDYRSVCQSLALASEEDIFSDLVITLTGLYTTGHFTLDQDYVFSHSGLFHSADMKVIASMHCALSVGRVRPHRRAACLTPFFALEEKNMVFEQLHWHTDPDWCMTLRHHRLLGFRDQWCVGLDPTWT